MINNIKTPGVYIDEFSSLPPSISAVSTAIPAFIGYTQETNHKGEDLQYKPYKIASMVEYQQYFGGPQLETNINISVDEKTATREINVTAAFNLDGQGRPERSKHNLYYALQHYFMNGGGPCYIVSVGQYLAFGTAIPAGDPNTGLQKGLAEIEKIDEVTILLFPEAQGMTDASAYYGLANLALEQCGNLKDRVAICEVYDPVFSSQFKAIDGSTAAGDTANGLRAGITSSSVKYGAAYYPNLQTSLVYSYDVNINVVSHFVDGTDNGDVKGVAIRDVEGVHNEIYEKIKAVLTQLYVELPPGPAAAGVYAKVDRDRGVWKAPANVGLIGVIQPVALLSDDQQGGLNIDPTSGKSVNVIRSFAGKGSLVWGARTLAGNDNEYRYISVRRFFNMVEESTKKATEQFIFEPNDANTWIRVKSMIENFLTIQWRSGALQGATPEHAFYVKVGLGDTMTPVDILEGRMIVEIGMAPVRPAEFIILRFTHKLPES